MYYLNGGHNKLELITNVFLNTNTDADEIKNWKEHIITLLKNIPDKAEYLKPIIELIVSTVSPAKIYLVDYRSEEITSYTGLIVVTPANSIADFQEMESMFEVVGLKDHRICCSLHRETIVQNGLRNGHPFYSLYCTEENLLYDNGNKIYPPTPLDLLEKVRNESHRKMNFYLEKSRHFYNSAIYIMENSPSEIAIFMFHQTIEMILRGFIISLTDYDRQTHKIRSLSRYGRRCIPELSDIFQERSSSDKELMDVLEASYVDARYKDNYNFKIKMLPLLREKVEKLIDSAEKMLKRLQPVQISSPELES